MERIDLFTFLAHYNGFARYDEDASIQVLEDMMRYNIFGEAEVGKGGLEAEAPLLVLLASR